MQKRKKADIRRIIDLCMTILLLCLMSYQVTGEEKHEWTGVIMTLTVIIHQFLNRRWYTALFKGKYNTYRTVTTIVNLFLLAAIAVTAFCGMAMSEYAVPFLYLETGVFLVRPTHLALSHWAFILMGLHLGLHMPLIASRWKLSEGAKAVVTLLGALLCGVGFWLFLKNGMPNYLFFRVPFAFLDYEKSIWLVFLENVLMLSTWVFVGAQAAILCQKTTAGKKRNPAVIACCLLAAAVLGLALNTIFPGENDLDFNSSGWAVEQSD